MPEYVKDADGDVWCHEGDDRWCLPGEGVLTRAEVERKYGPALPCTADGVLLPAVDVRDILADAFEDFARRSIALRGDRLWNERFEIAAQETAAALRSGEIG